MTNLVSTNTVDITFLKSEIGDEKEVIVHLLSVFKNVMISFSQTINEHMINENVLGIKEQTHKLAPSAKMLGLDYFYNLLIMVESKSTIAVDTEQMKDGIREALQIIDLVVPQIDHLVKNYE